MTPRLLTLLDSIETALAKQGSQAVSAPPLRSVNFHKSVARMVFADGSGSILLQNFTLADGQICVRSVFTWANGTTNGSNSIYPREQFDWIGAADQFAKAWIAGQPAAASPIHVATDRHSAESSMAESVEAAG
jgi:hypothetical protein